MSGKTPTVAVVLGSKSDLPDVQGAFEIFDDFGVEFVARVISAHRTPEKAAEFASSAAEDGIKVIICAVGMAAHLGGVMAAHTTLPVIGLPMAKEPFNGLDSLLSTVQMPPGVPVAAVTVGAVGSKNAALFAISILSISDEGLARKLADFRMRQTRKVIEADQSLADDAVLRGTS